MFSIVWEIILNLNTHLFLVLFLVTLTLVTLTLVLADQGDHGVGRISSVPSVCAETFKQSPTEGNSANNNNKYCHRNPILYLKQ